MVFILHQFLVILIAEVHGSPIHRRGTTSCVCIFNLCETGGLLKVAEHTAQRSGDRTAGSDPAKPGIFDRIAKKIVNLVEANSELKAHNGLLQARVYNFFFSLKHYPFYGFKVSDLKQTVNDKIQTILSMKREERNSINEIRCLESWV